MLTWTRKGSGEQGLGVKRAALGALMICCSHLCLVRVCPPGALGPGEGGGWGNQAEETVSQQNSPRLVLGEGPETGKFLADHAEREGNV